MPCDAAVHPSGPARTNRLNHNRYIPAIAGADMLLTVFTPTYNRANTLRRTFESLCCQKFKDFEWIIVDDGSTDDTEDLVHQFINEAHFPIKYIRQEHGGKHRAYNRAIGIAEGELFFTVDSDDWLTDDSLSIIAENQDRLRGNGLVGGIIALKKKPDAGIYGNHFPQAVMEATLEDLEAAGCGGERSFVLKTEIARRYPFPEFDGEDFVTESVVFDRIGSDWSFLAVDKSLTICEYQAGGLSSGIYKQLWNNPTGFMVYHSQRTDMALSWRKVIKHALRYQAFRRIAPYNAQWSVYRGRHGALVALVAPSGFLGKIYYRFKMAAERD